MLVGILAINYPETYNPQPWHGTLFVIATALLAFLFNTFLAQKLPLIEGCILIVHVFGFFGILIPLWVLAPTQPASVVFSAVEDRGGWGSAGLSCLVGLTGPVFALIGICPYMFLFVCGLTTVKKKGELC
jgi:choline transport protein